MRFSKSIKIKRNQISTKQKKIKQETSVIFVWNSSTQKKCGCSIFFVLKKEIKWLRIFPIFDKPKPGNKKWKSTFYNCTAKCWWILKFEKCVFVSFFSSLTWLNYFCDHKDRIVGVRHTELHSYLIFSSSNDMIDG